MMNRPSSTITFATLAGMGASIIWELVDTFTQVEPTMGLVSGSAIFVAALAGYFKRENVLPLK